MKLIASVSGLLMIAMLVACGSASDTKQERSVSSVQSASSSVRSQMIREAQDEEKSSYVAFRATRKGDEHTYGGVFPVFQFSLIPDESDPSDYTKATIEMTVVIESLVTESDALTADLLSPTFFDVENYPTAHFVSTSIKRTDDTHYDVRGTITVKDVTEKIRMETEINTAHLYAQFEIDRTDFGVGPAAKGDHAIATDIPMEVNIVFPKM